MQMIERVARAMCNVAHEDDNESAARDWNSNQGVYREMAYAALEAIREPTDTMINAAGLTLANEIHTDPWDCLSAAHEEAFDFEVNGSDAYEEAWERLKIFGIPIFSAMISGFSE